MPGWFGTAIALLVIGALLAAASVRARTKVTVKSVDGEPGTARARLRRWVAGTAAAFIALGVACVAASAYDRVDIRNVGILTSFGRPQTVHDAGPWWHAPWKRVDELSEAYQQQSFESNSYQDAEQGKTSNSNDSGPAVLVRLGNNSNAYVVENLQWRLKSGAALRLFQDYGGSNVFGTIQNSIVDKQAQAILSRVFAGFNPQQQVAVNDNLPTVPGLPPIQTVALVQPDLVGMANTVKKGLQAAVGNDVEIQYVNIPRIFYDPNTQAVIDGFNTKVQETKNAIQDANTALARKQANDTIAQSVQNPLVVVAQCITEQINQKKDPAGCWPIGGTPLINAPRQGG